MAKYSIVLLPSERTVIAGGGAGGGSSSFTSFDFKTHTDPARKVTIEANHLAYEDGFVILYDESPYDPKFVTSRNTLHAIYRMDENA